MGGFAPSAVMPVGQSGALMKSGVELYIGIPPEDGDIGTAELGVPLEDNP